MALRSIIAANWHKLRWINDSNHKWWCKNRRKDWNGCCHQIDLRKQKARSFQGQKANHTWLTEEQASLYSFPSKGQVPRWFCNPSVFRSKRNCTRRLQLYLRKLVDFRSVVLPVRDPTEARSQPNAEQTCTAEIGSICVTLLWLVRSRHDNCRLGSIP